MSKYICVKQHDIKDCGDYGATFVPVFSLGLCQSFRWSCATYGFGNMMTLRKYGKEFFQTSVSTFF